MQNVSATPAYRDAIAAGRLATTRGYALTDDDRLRGTIIERLMCDLRVDIAATAAAHGRQVSEFAPEFDAIDALANDGLVQRLGSLIVVPDHARPLVRTVCAVFDAYLASGEARYSRAV